MRIFVLARTQHEITEQIYPALAQAVGVGASVVGYATSTDGVVDNLDQQLAATRAEAILVKMTISQRGEEEAVLGNLAAHGLPLVVVLPRGRKTLEESLRAAPGVAALAVEPVDYGALVRGIERGDRDREGVTGASMSLSPAAPSLTTPAAPAPAHPSASAPPPADADIDASAQAQATSPPQAGAHQIVSASTSPPSTPPPGASPQGTGSPPRPLAHSLIRSFAHSPPRFIAFTSGLVGGTGKSTLAGTLAWVLAHEGQARVLLLSLGNPPAAVSHFKLSRWPHVGLFLEGKESFERVVQRLPLPLPSSGNAALSVAIAPGGLALYDKIGGRMPDDQGAVMRLVEQAAAHFEIVIADLPPDLSGWAVHPLLAAQDHHHNADVVLVARPTVAGQAGVVQAKALVQSLGRGPACRLHLVLNDYYRGQDLGPKDFVTGVDQMLACPSLAAVVPHGSNNVVRLAQNEGLPLPLAEGTDGVVEGVRRLAVHLGFEMGVEIEIGREGGDRDRERSLESEGVKAGRKRPGISLPGIRIKVTD